MTRIGLMNNNINALGLMNNNAPRSVWRDRQDDLLSTLLNQYGTNNTTTPNAMQTFLNSSRSSAQNITSAIQSVSRALVAPESQPVANSSDDGDTSTDSPTEPTRNTDLVNAMRSLVNGFNGLRDATEGVNDIGVERLFAQIENLGNSHALGLSRIGITFNEHGFMDINEEMMNSAEESGELARFVQDGAGRNYGFMNSLDRIASSVASDPTRFLSVSANRDLQGLTNANPARAAAFSSRLSALHNTGMLFDSMF